MASKYKILSWDVGIKHLAYCLMEYDKDTKKFKVLKWDIVDIIDSNKVVCCGKLKSGKVCNKNASFVGINLDDTTSFYCGSHKSQHCPLEDNWENNFSSPLRKEEIGPNNKCSFILPKKGTECGKRSHVRSNENADVTYCRAHCKQLITKRKKKYQIQKIKKKKATSTSPDVLIDKMYTKLDAIPELLTADQVLIENQPTYKNPAMKTVSCFLFAYFSQKRKGNNMKRNFISPSNKLKVDNDQIQQILGKVDSDDRTYAIVVKLTKKYLSLDYKNDKEDVLLDPFVPKGKIRDNFVHLILTYLMDKKDTLSTIKKNQIFNSISISADTFIQLLKKIEKDDGNYDITKLLAIKYTEVLMNEKNNWLTHLSKFKKKDDLCDALLQGYYYLISHGF